MHFFGGCSVSAVSILHRHKNEQQGVVVLLNESVKEVGCAPQVKMQLQGAHVPLPLGKLLLNRLDLPKKLHLGALFLSDPGENLQSELVPMRAIHPVVLVSIHWVIDLLVVEVFVARAEVFSIAMIIPKWGPVENGLL